MDPDRKSHADLALEIASDQANASIYIAWLLKAINRDQKSRLEKFQPLRSYPGSPFNPQQRVPIFDPAASMGGYRRMDIETAKRWALERGLPI